MKIVAQGGNTGMCEAARPRDADRNVVSRLDRMRKIRAQPTGEYNHVGGRLHLGGGARGGFVRGPLFFQIDTNVGGAIILRYGPTRDLGLGIEAVLRRSDQARRRPERPSSGAKLADMTALRLIADDLTGALDTAAEFVGLVGPVPVYWSGAIPLDLPPSAALDSGTRELGEREAVAGTAQLAKGLVDAKIAYKKVDSLLRGHVVAEVVACLRGGGFRYCVLAPAFPYQGRVMRDGVQWRRTAGGEWSAVADIRALLVRAGLPAVLGKAGETLKPGITVYDAETDDDLRRVAKLGATTDGPVLWCGSAGLAQALAGERKAPSMAALRRPVLGLFGSDQAVTVSQLESCGPYHLRLSDGGPDSAADFEHLLRKTGVAMASLDLPSGLGRGEAAQRIGSELARLTRQVPRPGTLVVAGGETLRGLCAALEATALEVQGQIEPGLPYSRLRGGRWDSVEVVSKSGAFGRPEIWRDLLHLDGANARRAQR